MNKIDKKVINLVLEAQKASDKAKKAAHINERSFWYKQKDYRLVEAIRTLEGVQSSRISWKVEHKPDQNGHPSIIVYFEFKLNSKQYQFSFHNFNWRKFPVEKGKKTIQWNGQIGGCRRALQSIISSHK